jgi:hypothetical protein
MLEPDEFDEATKLIMEAFDAKFIGYLVCRFCNSKLSQERSNIYDHCSSSDCVLTWRRERLEQFRLDLVPKQGFAISFKSDEHVRSIGRSSGRSI